MAADAPTPTPPILPMLATAGAMPALAEQDRWAFEMKWDGMRMVSELAVDVWRGWSRTGRDITTSFPELALSGLADRLGHRDLVLDGEVFALGPAGVASFSQLQKRIHVANPSPALLAEAPVHYVVFDLLRLDGHDTTSLTYRERRQLLESLDIADHSADDVGRRGPVQVPAAVYGAGELMLEAARDHGMEGLVAKRLDGTYRPGRRSPTWRKIKFLRTQEVVVIGWTAGEGSRQGTIGALLLAVREVDPDGWRYIGKVGTGFTDDALADLSARLRAIERADAVASAPGSARGSGVHWVDPTVVGEVAFTEWTPDGRLRHPTWRGLRPDKAPTDTTIGDDRW